MLNIIEKPKEEIFIVKKFTKIIDGEKIPMLALLTINNGIMFCALSKMDKSENNINNENNIDNENNINNEINKKEKIIYDIKKIGDTWEENNKDRENNLFNLSIVSHKEKTWIITSYYHDKYFKIHWEEGKTIKTIKVPETNVEFNENIISLETFFLTEQNSYIVVRSINDDNISIHFSLTNIIL